MESPAPSPIEPAAPQVPTTPQPPSLPTPPSPSYADRLKALLDKPEFIDDLCNNIANGGDLITFCKMQDIRYSDVRNWLLEGHDRGKKLAAAENSRTEWVRNRVLNELRLLALSDLREAFTPTGDLKPPAEWPESIARALSAVDMEELFSGSGREREMVGYTKKVKLYNKTEALKLIGQEVGLFIQKHKVEMVDKLEDIVASSWETEPAKP